MRHDRFTRAASLAPSTFDAKTNTVELTLSTGADVRRLGYIERLPIANADLSGIVGAPVLDTHNQGSTRAVLGVIEKAWKTDGEIRARVKLSKRDDVAGIVADVREGILRNVSIGYVVSKWRDETNSKGERIRVALAFRIIEASLVSVGADSGAVVRSPPMKKKVKAGAKATPEAETDVIDNPATGNVPVEEPTVAETRAAIRDTFRRALPNDLNRAATEADAIIDEDGTVQEAQSRAYEILQERTSRAPRVRIVQQHDNPEALMQRRQGALYARVTGAAPKPEEREFYNVRLVDFARQFLTERGVSTMGLSEHDIIARAHTTSDFPLLLEGTGNRVLLEAFEAAQTPLIQLGRSATAPDFRTLNRLRISEMGALTPLNENSELKNISRSETADSYAIESFGGIFALSFKAQVNDDLSAFADFGRAAAQQVAQYQKAVIVDLIQSNPNSEDGNPLFGSVHGNLLTPSGIFDDAGGLTPLAEARYRMRVQTGLDGITKLNLRPKFLVVSAALETDAQRATSQVFAALATDVNIFEGALEVLVESSLTDGDWYVFTATASAPVFEHAWLQGFAGPQLASQENFRTLARDYRVVAHWGAGLLPGGWRGAVANFGSLDSNSTFIP